MASRIVKGWETLPTDEELLEMLENPDANTETVVPEEPVKLIRTPDKDGKLILTKVIYGNLERLMNGDTVVVWSEELLRDDATGKLIGIKTTRADGTITKEMFTNDSDGNFDHSSLEYL